MPKDMGGYDQPYHAGAVRMGRNKEITDDFSFLTQAHEAIAKARTSANGKMKPVSGNGPKRTNRPLSV